MPDTPTSPDPAEVPAQVTFPEPVDLPDGVRVDELSIDQLLDVLSQAHAWRDALRTMPVSARQVADLRKAVELANKVTRTINDIRTAEAPGPDESLVPEPAATEDTHAEGDTPAEGDAPLVPELVDAAASTPTAAQAAAQAAGRAVDTQRPRTPVGFRSASGQDYDATLGLNELGARMAAAMSARDGVHIIAAVDRWGFGESDPRRLGANAFANHEVIYGGRRDLSVTAAICAPPEPVDAPACTNDSEPVGDSLRTFPIRNGQIQVYAPLSLADIGDTLTIPAPDCEGDCGTAAPNVNCGTVTSCDPLPAVAVEPMSACLCIPESYMWGNETRVEDAIRLTYQALAAAKEAWRLSWIRSQSFVRTFTAPYGHSLGTKQAILQVLSRLDYDRTVMPGGSWVVAVPRGANYAVMADQANANGINADGMLEDIVRTLGNVRLVEYLDWDGDAPGAAPEGFVGALGNAGSAALEDFHQNPSFYIYHEDKFLHGTLGRSEWGIDATDRELLTKGCRQLIVREWNMRPVAFGCQPSVVVDFDTACVSGARPDTIAPFCP